MTDETMSSVVELEEVQRFLRECLVKCGASVDHAQQHSVLLAEADHRGHYSHGLNRLDVYVRELQAGVCAHTGEPEILKNKGATAWVDGKNLLGGVVGNFCMDLAIEKAKALGIGIVSCKGSNHFGIAGWYAARALNQGLIGMSMTNANPCSFPNRSAKLAIGTNPIAFFAPASNGDSFELDMATTTVAIGKIEIAHRKGEKQIPLAWAADKTGKATTDPAAVLSGGGPLPLGGSENTGGYKGSGLGLMVELLTAGLGGATWAPNMRKFKTLDQGPSDTSHCFLAIDPEAFAPDFADRLGNMLTQFRELPPVETDKPVLIAGHPEKQHIKECARLGGVPYHANQIQYANGFATELGVEPMKIKTTPKI